MQLGVVPGLVSLVAYGPRLPDPLVVPAFLDVFFSGVGGKRSGKKKGSSNKGAGAIPLGQKDIIATVAAACLRFLALVPEFVDQLMGELRQTRLWSSTLSTCYQTLGYMCFQQSVVDNDDTFV